MKNNKTIPLTLISFLLSASAFAQDVFTMTLPKGAKTLVQATNAEVIKVEDGCPPGAFCYVASTKVTLSFQMHCTSKLSPLSYNVIASQDDNDNQLKISYAAYEIVNENAAHVRCIKAGEAQATITVFGAYEQKDIKIFPSNVVESKSL